MIRYLANLLTVFRMLCSVLLLGTAPFSSAFYVLYTLCGITDVADGAVARKTQTVSKTGAMLDSAADVMFWLAALSRLLPAMRLSPPIWQGIWIVAGIRGLSYLIGALKYRRFAAIHTILNKLVGILLFFAPYSIRFCSIETVLAGLCIAAGISAAEELAITVFSKHFDPEIRSIFQMIA